MSLALAALAGPATVLAAQADADFSSTAVLDAVSPNGFIAYDVSFVLADGETSNLSQLFMQAATPNGWDLVGVEAGSESRPGTCDASGTNLACTFGSVGPDDEAITMRVVYQVSSSTGNFTVEFKFNTTGVSNDKKKRSHGDDYVAADQISVNGNAHFAASYVQAAGVVVADNQSINRQNPQATKVTSPAANIPVVVGEDADISACQALFSGCFGQASIIEVGNSTIYPSGFKVEIAFDANKPGATFVHFFSLGGSENITATCDATHSNAPCKTVTTASGKTFATLWLLQNGKVFGH